MKKVLFLLLWFGLAGCFGKVPEKTGLEGKPLPSFKLFLEDSISYFNTNKIPTGNPIVLFYFGPHCPYSRAQMEEILNHMQSLKEIRFYVFTTWSFPEMKTFYTYYQLNKYSNIIVGVDYSDFFGDYFKVPGVPYMAIFGKDKLLKQAFIGKVDSRQIKAVAEE